jgi:hypothetical protein
LATQPSLAICKLEGEVRDLTGQILYHRLLLLLTLALVQEVGDALVTSQGHLESDTVGMTGAGVLD